MKIVSNDSDRDEAIMNDDGLIAITGRVKDMIIRGGENVYPTEIENHLLRMPGVSWHSLSVEEVSSSQD